MFEIGSQGVDTTRSPQASIRSQIVHVRTDVYGDLLVPEFQDKVTSVLALLKQASPDRLVASAYGGNAFMAQLSRRKKLASFAALAILIFGVPSAVWANLKVDVTGIVKDVLGSPIASARVSDGETSVYTATDGSYTIAEPSGTSFSLTTSKSGNQTKTKSAVALPGTTVNFDLNFSLVAAVSPVYSNSVPLTLSLEATSIAPPDTTVTVETGSSTIQLELLETTSGSSKWRGNHTLDSETIDGSLTFVFRGRRDGTLVTDSPSRAHVLDRVLPSIGIPTIVPSKNSESAMTTTSAYPTLSLPVFDSLAGVDPSRSTFMLTRPDGVTFTVTPEIAGGNAEFFFRDQAEAGTWTWTAIIFDRAGNASNGSWEFKIDPILPFVDLPPNIAMPGVDLELRAVVPMVVDDQTVRIRLFSGELFNDFPMQRVDRTFKVTIPGSYITDATTSYEVLAVTGAGEVHSNLYQLFVGGDPQAGDCPLQESSTSATIPKQLWSSGLFTHADGDESSAIGPATFATHVDVLTGLTTVYVSDNANSRINKFSGGTYQSSFPAPVDVIDLGVIQQTQNLAALTTKNLIIYDPNGNQLQSLPVPQPDVSCSGILDGGGACNIDTGIGNVQIFTSSTSSGSWNLYVGNIARWVPIFIEGSYIDPAIAAEETIPGIPLTGFPNDIYLTASLVNGTPLLGIIDLTAGGAAIVSLPPLPLPSGMWIPDSLGELVVAEFKPGEFRLYLPVGVHQEDGFGNITANQWQVFGFQIGARTLTYCWPQCPIPVAANIGCVLRAEVPSYVYTEQQRIFGSNWLGADGLYQLRSYSDGVEVVKWNWWIPLYCAFC